ncbi:hypothetical protein CK203_093718 [Vitis vinifera]|uniref:Reverse transcriptase domain-containing protein n=1 Tax=Vitis vinifera TaxID=29760 RepID=A0A438D208_VITVI|nr:hypothetical protein CK203_093718 [Vitis vinifera]
MEARREAREENKKWVLLEEITWRQKSREVWLKEGDRNTGIFHKMVNAHRRRNNVDQIRINGIWHSEENGINEAIVNAFRTLLSNPGDWRPPLSGCSVRRWRIWMLVFWRCSSQKRRCMMCYWDNNENGILCKLDIEKAYDNVDWSFRLTVIPKMGFGEKLIRWIKWCISTASFFVLVNDTSTDFFQSSRGLRQGDPLSPYLFVIDMEVFSLFLKRVVDEGFMLGCRMKGYVSGLRINLEKSELIPVGRVENIDDLALDFGCKWVVSRPLIWAFPWVLRLSQCQCGMEWKSISVEAEDLRKFKGISFGGWQFGAKASFSKMGVGVLIGLWNQVIRGKYGEDRGGWCSREVREAHGVGLWKGMRMDWELVGARISFRVGNGRRVRFWRDRWCGDSPLCVLFPSLFVLAVDKEARVADIWDPLVEGGWGAGIPFFKSPK